MDQKDKKPMSPFFWFTLLFRSSISPRSLLLPIGVRLEQESELIVQLIHVSIEGYSKLLKDAMLIFEFSLPLYVSLNLRHLESPTGVPCKTKRVISIAIATKKSFYHLLCIFPQKSGVEL